MSRRGAQFEITNLLQHLHGPDDVVSFLNVLGTELNVNSINSLLIKIFINIKHQLKDESLKNILKWLKENSTLQPAITEANARSKSQYQFNKIPDDVFNQIASYLSYLDTIKLSQTHHSFHKKLHNKSFLNLSNNGNRNTNSM